MIRECSTCQDTYLILDDNGGPTHCPDCDKASFSHGTCIDCCSPATKIIAWFHFSDKTKLREGPYVACDMCAWHSVKNRGATDLGPYTPELETDG